MISAWSSPFNVAAFDFVSGGFVILVMRQEYLTYVADYKDRIDPMMEQYEQENLWRKMERTVVPDYSFGKPGVVFVYKVL